MSETPFDLGIGAGLPTDRFRDLDLVSAGGQGLLYRAVDTVLRRTVAVKVLTADHPGEAVPTSVTSQAAMSWHPNVVPLHDIGRTANGHLYLIMEYVEGGSCEQLRRRGPVDVDRTLRLALELADALQACHDRGIVHCDVKPSNIMLDPQGHVRLGDFGSARPIDHATTTLAEIQGSLMYVAPEALEGVRPAKEADVYAFALTIRSLLTGEQPWTEARTLAEAIATRLHTHRLDFDELAERPRLRHALEAATDGDPENRPLLPELIAELRISAGRESAPAIAAPPRPRGRRIALAAAAAGLLVGGLTGFVVRPTTVTERKPAAKSTGTINEFCGAALTARAALIPAINELNEHLSIRSGRAPDPFVAVTMLVSDYPTSFAKSNQPMVDAAARLGSLREDAALIPPGSLDDVAMVDGLYRVSYSASTGLIDSRTLEVTPRNGLPQSVSDAAHGYANLMKFAKQHCGIAEFATSSDQIAETVEGLARSLKLYLDDRAIMSRFFNDDLGRSSQLFTAHQVDLILSSSDFISRDIDLRFAWIAAMLKDNAIRNVVFRNHFTLVISALNARPDPQAIAAEHPDWVNELREQWEQVPGSERNVLSVGAPKVISAFGFPTLEHN